MQYRQNSTKQSLFPFGADPGRAQPPSRLSAAGAARAAQICVARRWLDVTTLPPRPSRAERASHVVYFQSLRRTMFLNPQIIHQPSKPSLCWLSRRWPRFSLSPLDFWTTKHTICIKKKSEENICCFRDTKIATNFKREQRNPR